LRFDFGEQTCEVIEQKTLMLSFDRIVFDKLDGNRFAFIERNDDEEQSKLLIGKLENGRMLIDGTPITLDKELKFITLIGQKVFGSESGNWSKLYEYNLNAQQLKGSFLKCKNGWDSVYGYQVNFNFIEYSKHILGGFECLVRRSLLFCRRYRSIWLDLCLQYVDSQNSQNSYPDQRHSNRFIC
jgi:hypothetical protein